MAGIELIRVNKKGQLRCQATMSKTPAEFFYELAGQATKSPGLLIV